MKIKRKTYKMEIRKKPEGKWKIYRLLLFAVLAFPLLASGAGGFSLVGEKQQATIHIAKSEPECVRLAVEDFINDVAKITGKVLKVSEKESSSPGTIFIRTKPDSQKWEAYSVEAKDGNLYIIGSDERGTMFGIYHFIEKYLEIDPMYLWTDKPPVKRETLVFEEVSISSDEPSFKFRGWFVNDEDFLTEWMQFSGRRNNDYKYYSRIMHPDVTDMVIETALRLRMNLIIPSSFNDILNPPEEYAIRQVSIRGLFVSQHHIEPLGVGGFNFDDYFEKQGEEPPLFSFMKNPDKLKEVWTVYVKEWSKHSNVVWQLGLRGRGDRPMWNHDPSIPKDDESRGRLISEAITYQYNLVKKYDPDGYMTLTLWMEMADLMAKGLINIPDDISIVFADNSPGWGFKKDFYDIHREPDKNYGIYYHHQLWTSGPHFIQGIPPQKTFEVIKLAVDYESDNYCILNVGNVREFVLGLKLSSEYLYHFEDYDLEKAFRRWLDYYYKNQADEAYNIYQSFFDHYVLDTTNEFGQNYTTIKDDPFLLDGHIAGMLKSMLTDLNFSYGLPEFKSEDWTIAAEFVTPKPVEWNTRDAKILEKIKEQKSNLTPVIEQADRLYEKMEGYPAYMFNVNMRVPAKMFNELMNCAIEMMLATQEEFSGNREKSVEHLSNALASMEKANIIKEPMLSGKWAHWYRGEYKIRFSSYEDYLAYLIENVKL